MLPVLIGSKALEYYGYNKPVKDIDLIVDLKTCKDVHYYCDKKENNICWFDKYPIDFDMVNDDMASLFVFNICNESRFKVVKLFNKMDVIIPSLEILYAIKKSHIHRILPLTKNNSNDLAIWKKSMDMYLWMRDKLGYQRMDEIIYGKDEDNIIKKIFYLEFDQVTKKFGDTNISMDKPNEEFFNDNVPRFINHDDLHKKVAKLCRNEETDLYDQFKVNKENASLNKELFLKGDQNIKIQCLREEIMVLFLERKWIPELKRCYIDKNIGYTTFDIIKKQEELDEIIAHFITNLCGQGHAWLRQYGLDHYHILGNLDSYDLNSLFKLVCDIVGMENFTTKREIINIEHILNNKKSNDDFFDKVLNPNAFKSNGYYYSGYHSSDDEGKIDNKVYNITDYPKISSIEYELDDEQKYIDLFEADTDKKMIYYKLNYYDFILYNINENIGAIVCDKIIKEIFYLDIELNNKNLRIDGEQIAISSPSVLETVNCSFERKITYDYYYSKDDSCGWRNEHEYEKSRYLSSYGNCSSEIKVMFEKIARHILDVKDDKDYDTQSAETPSGSDNEW